MSGLSRQEVGVIASGFVTGATGAGTNLKGCATARTGAGVYTITLDNLLAATEGHVLVECRLAQATVQVVHTSATVKTVNFLVVAAATDADFSFEVKRHSFATNS